MSEQHTKDRLGGQQLPTVDERRTGWRPYEVTDAHGGSDFEPREWDVRDGGEFRCCD